MRTVADVKGGQRWTANPIGFREIIIAVAVVILVGSAMFATAWRRLAFIDLGYEIRSLERGEAGLQRFRREMEIERSMLSNPERIENLARSKLGMVEPGSGQIWIIR